MLRLIQEFWPLLLPALLGFAAVFALLPKARRSTPAWGALAGGIALALLVMRLSAIDAGWQERTLFLAFSAVALAGGFMLVTQRNPAHAALSFTLVIIATCGLFLLNGAAFLMAATLIVYAGAIIVTFLFVVMLAQQAGLTDADARSREPFLASLAGFLLLGAMLCVIQRTYDQRDQAQRNERLLAVMATLDQLARVQTVGRMHGILGDPPEDPLAPDARLRPQIEEELRSLFENDPLEPEIANLRQHWGEGKAESLPEVRDIAARFLARGSQILSKGVLVQPPQFMGVNIPESAFSGAASSSLPKIDFATGRNRERLPADNVAALGRSLFTDYLIPVLATAVLLLVATIGAIAIAARHGEGLR